MVSFFNLLSLLLPFCFSCLLAEKSSGRTKEGIVFACCLSVVWFGSGISDFHTVLFFFFWCVELGVSEFDGLVMNWWLRWEFKEIGFN